MKGNFNQLVPLTCVIIMMACSAMYASIFDDVQRVVFLGDSITHSGQYISMIEAKLRDANSNVIPEIINLGLPSETCSGLSEPAHPFPRPNVHERLDRILKATKPDLVFACYGMNDGIYHPFSEERFDAFKQGIGGLIKKVKASGAKVVLLTPPPFDPLPMQKKGKLLPKTAQKFAWFEIYENYDSEVMSRYARWIMDQRDHVTMVIDVRTPILNAMQKKRKSDPDFSYSDDGVHIDQGGHAALARAIAGSLELPKGPPNAELVSLISKKRDVMHLAWLTHVGHQRPGPNSKLTLDEAIKKTDPLEEQIAELFSKTK